MYRKLIMEYEVFEEYEEPITVLSVIDAKKDEVLNMFNSDEAEKVYKLLIGENVENKQ